MNPNSALSCMKVAVRVDSSAVIGSGHLMRCLTLADRMCKEKNAEVHFISRDLEGNLHEKIKEAGFALHVLPRDPLDESLRGYAAWLTVSQAVDAEETKAILRSIGPVDCLVVDSYALDSHWETEMRPFTQEIFVIDDLANRVHDCDILLEQGFHPNQAERYEGLVPANCQMLLGPTYALLRTEFYEARRHMRKRTGALERIMVFYGGSDSTNETVKAIRAITMITLPKVQVDVIVGGSNRRKDEIQELCAMHPSLRFYRNVRDMAVRMSEADLMLGAGGTTSLERCFLGLPALVTVTAENQWDGCIYCARLGILECLGVYTEVSEETIMEALQGMTRERLLAMTNNCDRWFPQGKSEG